MALTWRAAAASAALVSALAFPSAASAEVRIPAGNVVKEVQVVGDSVRVDGTVKGHVIVVDGDLVVGRTGKVQDPVLVGGDLRTEGGGRVAGEVFRLGGSWPELTFWQIELIVILLLGLRIAVVAVGVAAADLVASRPIAEALRETLRASPLPTLAVGALVGFGLAAAAVLLALTVLGLPVALAFVGVLLVAGTTGVALALSAVERDARARRLSAAVLAVPVVGDALWALAAIAGLGAALRYAARRRPRRAEPAFSWHGDPA